ncbi:hypothetical protein [Kordiimonas aestuarii]|uniref:hypothetical protein n=1 Tax=Kordiimonas aestuarii TaxID=1005925 RepID=UPI0021D1C4CA|nr:hypothetical protein [Kordiimonas aestuarii]
MTRVVSKKLLQYRDAAINLGLENLRRDNPWPAIDYAAIKPFDLSAGTDLDGRRIIEKAIVANDAKTMLEIGVFLGGACLQWLNTKGDLTVIGVDPWDDDWSEHIEGAEKHAPPPYGLSALSEAEIAEIAVGVRSHGYYQTCLNNLRAYKDRFIPVRRFSQDAITYLKERQVKVDLLHIGEFKRSSDLERVHQLFPDAILCGEYALSRSTLDSPVEPEMVKAFAAEHGFEIEAEHQCWVLHKATPKAHQCHDTDTRHGLERLRRDNPWPDFRCGAIKPFHLSLDGNGQAGREIVEKVILENDVKTVVEIGVFLGGSSRQWLNTKEDLIVIGVDPWNHNWGDYIEDTSKDPVQSRSFSAFTEDEITKIVSDIRTYGNYQVCLNNMWAYRDRFIPVRRFSPEALAYLKERRIKVDLIYIDAFKRSIDLETAHELFPHAILCGDDWLWPDANGKFVMQDIVKNLAAAHGFEVESKRQSWVLHKVAT